MGSYDILKVFFIILIIVVFGYLIMHSRIYKGVNYDDMAALISGGHTDNKGSSKLKTYLTKIVPTSYKHHNKFIATVIDKMGESYAPVETLGDIKERLPYIANKKIGNSESERITRFGLHNGQRKLFLSELQALIKARRLGLKYCIYPGAAPGNKTHYLTTLFPSMKFILVDPNKFQMILPDGKRHRSAPHPDIVHLKSGYSYKGNTYDGSDWLDFIKSSSHRIYIIEDFMTVKLAHMLKSLDHVFISDIRSNIREADFPHDFDIYFNNSMMYNWIRILEPELSVLKMRIPFGDEDVKIPTDEYIHNEFKMSKDFGIDIFQNYMDRKLVLPPGVFNLQMWAGPSSSELRYEIIKKDLTKTIEHNVKAIDDKMMYFNVIERCLVYHNNPNSSKKLGFCHCNDCALENKIWTDYGYNKKQVHNAVHNLGKVSNHLLSRQHRYKIWAPLTENTMVRLIKSYRRPKLKRAYGKQKGNSGR